MKRLLILYYALFCFSGFFTNLVLMNDISGYLKDGISEDIYNTIFTPISIAMKYLFFPLGVIYGLGALQEKRWASVLGSISLTGTVTCFFIFEYIKKDSKTRDTNKQNLTWVIFFPVVLLFSLKLGRSFFHFLTESDEPDTSYETGNLRRNAPKEPSSEQSTSNSNSSSSVSSTSSSHPQESQESTQHSMEQNTSSSVESTERKSRSSTETNSVGEEPLTRRRSSRIASKSQKRKQKPF